MNEALTPGTLEHRVISMLMDVDEAWGNNHPSSIEDLIPLSQLRAADLRDLAC